MEVVHCCQPMAAGAAEGEERCRLLQVAWVAAEAAVVRLNLPEHGRGRRRRGRSGRCAAPERGGGGGGGTDDAEAVDAVAAWRDLGAGGGGGALRLLLGAGGGTFFALGAAGGAGLAAAPGPPRLPTKSLMKLSFCRISFSLMPRLPSCSNNACHVGSTLSELKTVLCREAHMGYMLEAEGAPIIDLSILPPEAAFFFLVLDELDLDLAYLERLLTFLKRSLASLSSAKEKR